MGTHRRSRSDGVVRDGGWEAVLWAWRIEVKCECDLGDA